jgi:Phosphotransferase enzyme family
MNPNWFAFRLVGWQNARPIAGGTMADRQFMREEHLAVFTQMAFGTSRRLAGFERLTGGSKKGVYRLGLDDGGSVILYAWSDDENYWTDNSTDPADPFAEASGLDLLESAAAALTAAGARAPKLLLVDRSKSVYPADIALAEDMRGGMLQQLIATDPAMAAAPLRELGQMLNCMARHTNPHLGKVAAVAAGTAPQRRCAEQIILDQALAHLSIVAGKVGALGQARERIGARVHDLFDCVRPRDAYGLIHGELGADHVMLDDDGRPVIIDIEGVMYFDAEWEHEFTKMRFGEACDQLGIDVDLDPARLDFYELARSLSLVEGPLRILETDFPDKDFMRGIVTWHTDKVLRLSD